MNSHNMVNLTRRQICSYMGTILSAAAVAKPPLLGAIFSVESEREAFLKAVELGDVEGVTRWLKKTPGLAKAVDDLDRSAYVLAQVNGHEGVAKALADTGLEFDMVESVLAEGWERFGS
ncbi:MAG: hypothetical protein ACI8TQ_001300 [Planctomycetota bacterium]|jgi:hypothetical protein